MLELSTRFEKALILIKDKLFPSTGTYESFATGPHGAGADNRKTLGTFSGVVIPCTLSMFSAILFLRMGYIVGFAGVTEAVVMFTLSYFIVMLTVLSVSAISTNGAIEGGGAYFMISRSIGPEFGGAMGIIFFFAQVFGSTIYLLGLVDAFVDTFVDIPQTRLYKILYGTAILLIMLAVVMIGAEIFAKTNILIFVIVFVTVIINFANFFIQKPKDITAPSDNTIWNKSYTLRYTGFSLDTFKSNLGRNYTTDYTLKKLTSFENVFAILFTGFTGVFAGSNMSGDLKNASKSIPSGTIGACTFSYFIYIILMFFIATTCDRDLLQNDYLFLDHICVVNYITTIGTLAVTFSASLSTFIGATRILEALALDDILGRLLTCVRIGRSRRGNPWVAVIVSWLFIQALLFVGQLNVLSPFVATFSLLTYATVNMACLALDLAGAPNFRPTFSYFNKYTSLLGFIASIVMAFVVNPVYASTSFAISVMLFIFIMFRTPGSSWGYISQALIFHQVRKYLLMLDTRKEHVKFWRPSILYLCNNPRSCIPHILFLNDMKKGGLFVIGTNVVADLTPGIAKWLEEQKLAWLSLIELLKIKAFVETTIDTNIRNGLQNLIMTAGLGGMTPNTVVLGFYDTATPVDFLNDTTSIPKKRKLLAKLRRSHDDHRGHVDELPDVRPQNAVNRISIENYIGIVRDAMFLRKNLCIMRHFHNFKRPEQCNRSHQCIDVWPMPPHVSTVFVEDDTTSMFLLQLGCILHMVGSWDKAHLRVMLTSSSGNFSLAEKKQMESIIKILRIEAEVISVVMPESIKNAVTEGERYSIVNQVVKDNSKNTVVTFLYLPRPPTDRDEEAEYQYISQLNILTDDLPPTLLVSGLSKVTTSQL